MTIPDAPIPYSAPATSVTYRGSVLATAIAVYLGGYILLLSLTTQLAAVLAGVGPSPDLIPYFVGQTLFGLAAVVLGYFVAPAPASTKFIASAIVVVATIVTVATQALRITSGAGGLPSAMTLANPFFMVALSAGAGWLIVRSARLGWLSLILAFALIPLPYLFTLSGISFAITQVVLLIAIGVVGAVILVAGRGRASAEVVYGQ